MSFPPHRSWLGLAPLALLLALLLGAAAPGPAGGERAIAAAGRTPAPAARPARALPGTAAILAAARAQAGTGGRPQAGPAALHDAAAAPIRAPRAASAQPPHVQPARPALPRAFDARGPPHAA